MHGVRAAHGRRRSLRQAEVADLTRPNTFGHRAHRLLHRDVLVDAVLVVEIDVVYAEALQRGIERLANVLRTALDGAEGAILAADVGQLGRDDDLVAPALERPAHELLVDEGP